MSARAESNQAIVPWWLVLIEGIALVIVGILFFVRPAMTAVISVQLLGIYWIISGIFAIIRIFVDRTAWLWNLILGILGIVAGLLVINNPLWSSLVVGNTAIFILGLAGIFMGILNIVQAFRGEGWGVGLLGVFSIILGIVLLINREILTLALPTTLGILAVAGGILAIIASFRQRSDESRRVEAVVAAYKAPAESTPMEAASEEAVAVAADEAEMAVVEEETESAAPAMAAVAAAEVVSADEAVEEAPETAESDAEAAAEVTEYADTPGEEV